MSDKETKVQEPGKQQGQKIKMIKTNGSDIEEIYVDGISGVMARNGVFKLDCYRVAGIDKEDNAEVRRISHRLVIPAVSMGELIQVVQGVVQNAAKLKEQAGSDDTSVN